MWGKFFNFLQSFTSAQLVYKGLSETDCFDMRRFNVFGRVLPSHGTSALQKGHRRALSGCLPSAVGAVAWSSLRDLDTASNLPGSHLSAVVAPVRSLSPEGEFYVSILILLPTKTDAHSFIACFSTQKLLYVMRICWKNLAII